MPIFKADSKEAGMTAITFDTLAYSNKLQNAGCPANRRKLWRMRRPKP